MNSDGRDGVRVMPAAEPRPETGPMRFGDDWPGVFIRGDNAMYYARCCAALLDGHAGRVERAVVESLVRTLRACHVAASSDPAGITETPDSRGME